MNAYITMYPSESAMQGLNGNIYTFYSMATRQEETERNGSQWWLHGFIKFPGKFLLQQIVEYSNYPETFYT